jgi:hypothetical protein
VAQPNGFSRLIRTTIIQILAFQQRIHSAGRIKIFLFVIFGRPESAGERSIPVGFFFVFSAFSCG